MYSDENVDAGESPEDPQAPDRAEEKRVDVPQNEEAVATEGADTGTPDAAEDSGNVEGRHNDELQTETPPQRAE